MQLPFNTSTLTQAIKPNNTNELEVTKLPEYTHAEVCDPLARLKLDKPIYLRYAVKPVNEHNKPIYVQYTTEQGNKDDNQISTN